MPLTPQDKLLFDALTSAREHQYQVLEQMGFVTTIVNIIVDTYRTSAHFIYELLQNADDAGATKARLELFADKLILVHNGKEAFTISDPSTERQAGVIPGHVNGITNFSLSNKPVREENAENKIGKFGIGFKAVYQYTDSPTVFNPPFAFSIQNYMVPRIIAEDKSHFRQGDTTAFIIPFNRGARKTAETAFAEISSKLECMSNPLLFLRHLNTLEWSIEGGRHKSFKKRVGTSTVDKAQPYIVVSKVLLDSKAVLRLDRSTTITTEDNEKVPVTISIVFPLSPSGEIAPSPSWHLKCEHAYCFFPTQEKTALPYLIHAPFVLTPSREGIKDERPENKLLLAALSGLMSDAVEILKAGDFLKPLFFAELANPESVPVSFRPIAEALVLKLKSGPYLPTTEGRFIKVADAHLCYTAEVHELLSRDSYKGLRALTKNSNATFIFPDHKMFKDENARSFVRISFTADKGIIEGHWMAARLSADFMRSMSKGWVISLFEYLANKGQYLIKDLQKKMFVPLRMQAGETKSLNSLDKEQRQFASPLDAQGFPQLFLTGIASTDHAVVAPYLLQSKEAREVLRLCDAREPDTFDELILAVIPKYKVEGSSIAIDEATEDFSRIIEAFKNANDARKAQLKLALRGADWVLCQNGEEGVIRADPQADIIYFPTEKLTSLFSKVPRIYWVDLAIYTDAVATFDNHDLLNLVKQLDIETSLYLNENKFNASVEDLRGYGFKLEYSSRTPIIHDWKINGLAEILAEIDLHQSIVLAEALESLKPTHKQACYEWFYYAVQHKYADSSIVTALKNATWIYDTDGEPHKPQDINLDDLHTNYPASIRLLLIELGAKQSRQNDPRYAGLNDSEKLAIKMMEDAMKEGLSEAEIAEAMRAFVAEKRRNKLQSTNGSSNITDNKNPNTLLRDLMDEAGARIDARRAEYYSQDGSNVPYIPKPYVRPTDPNEVNWEEDDYLPVSVNRKESSAKAHDTRVDELTAAIDLEAKRAEMQEQVLQNEPYSFAWFNALLELEDSYNAESRVQRNPVRISFGQAYWDKDGILVLTETPYIPAGIEDIGELQIVLYNAVGESKTMRAEAVSPQKSLLKVKLLQEEALTGYDLHQVSRVVVEASSADFIFEKLKNAFRNLRFINSDNLYRQLPQDINFVFGPPGTGKTTYLSWLIGGLCPHPLTFCDQPVMPLMDSEQKILVLTPTNKAADVLVERIIDNYEEANNLKYFKWLIRFGETKSSRIEESDVFIKNRQVPGFTRNKCTLVTTIARFPYDGYRLDDDRNNVSYRLAESHWDVIIFDEASMISLASFIHTVYAARIVNPNVIFYVGGDPFQISPVIRFDWEGWNHVNVPVLNKDGSARKHNDGSIELQRVDAGNIYGMVGLTQDNSFIRPDTGAKNFQVHNLRKQYRSVVSIGTLFSQYRYNGALEHDRSEAEMLRVEKKRVNHLSVEGLELKPITIIHFPVKRFESIYKTRSVNSSPYHSYSAIFTVELLKYMQAHAVLNNGTDYKIGVICPYKIQETLINRLALQAIKGSLKIVTGTVHGFQGDECDTVITVFNPPAYISSSQNVFLNKKNILNVAISRARDYSIILVPEAGDNTINIADLHQLERIKSIASNHPDLKDSVIEYKAAEIEKLLFPDGVGIEGFSFPTSHQSVNIYSAPKNKYEIRSDERAVDVQIKMD